MGCQGGHRCFQRLETQYMLKLGRYAFQGNIAHHIYTRKVLRSKQVLGNMHLAVHIEVMLLLTIQARRLPLS